MMNSKLQRRTGAMLLLAGTLSSCGRPPSTAQSSNSGESQPEKAVPKEQELNLRLYNSYNKELDARYSELPLSISEVELLPQTSLLVQGNELVKSVRFSWAGRTWVDDSQPFVFSEDAKGQAIAWPLLRGKNSIQVEAYSEPGAQGKKLGANTVSIEITAQGSDATPEQGEHEALRFWVTNTGRYVRLDEEGNFVDAEGVEADHHGEQLHYGGDLVLAASDVQLQVKEDQGYYVTHKAGAATIEFAFQVLLPEGYDPQVRYPLLIHLHHGWHIFRGTDNDGESLVKEPLFAGPRSLIKSENRHKFPAIILLPQLARVEEIEGVHHEWAAFRELSNETGNVQSAAQPSKSAAQLLRAYADLMLGNLKIKDLPMSVDPARVYLTGHSMGGLGSWDLIERLPEHWSGAVVMAGYPDHSRAAAAAQVPLWAFHHELDSYNPIIGTASMFEKVTSPPISGKLMRFTRLSFDTKGAGDQAHFQTPDAVWNDEPEVFTWLFSQVRATH